jgi:hypothetical protein
MTVATVGGRCNGYRQVRPIALHTLIIKGGSPQPRVPSASLNVSRPGSTSALAIPPAPHGQHTPVPERG